MMAAVTFAQTRRPKPVVGMILVFRKTASATLAGVPARVVYVWPRLHSGDYLVTLEYAVPVVWEQAFVQQIDAFLSELEPSS